MVNYESLSLCFPNINVYKLRRWTKYIGVFYLRSGNTGTINLFYNTRENSKRNFKLPKVNKSTFKHSFQYIAPKIFNQLPDNLKSCTNINSFLRLLKMWLFTTRDVSFFSFTLVWRWSVFRFLPKISAIMGYLFFWD